MTIESASDNKRLVRNTLMLYVRTLFIMCIGLFTSRLILNLLGFDDFGIYNVVGGFVGMFSIITNSLVATTQRYLTVELAKGEHGDPKRMFGVVLTVHIGLIVLLGIIFETVGLHILNHKLNIPEGREFAANVIFQISVFTSLLGLISTPYIGVIVSHERLKAFAFISLQDAILRLLICCALYLCDSDRLILYASLLGLISVWNQFLYMRYCHRNFHEVKTKLIRDSGIIKEVFGFAGMNFIGSVAYILSTEGITIILNLFFGVVVNAARAIGIQVQNMVGRFTGDFMTALNPQITKEYAGGDKIKSMLLCLRGAKLSFFIVLILAVPIFIRTEYLLEIWLKDFPEYTIAFVRLTLIVCMVSVLSQPLVTMNLAVGKIQAVSLWIGGIRLLTLPIVYIFLKSFNNPVFVYYIVIGMDFILIFIRTLILDSKTSLPFTRQMICSVIIPSLTVTIIAYFCSYYSSIWFNDRIDGLVLFGILSVIMSICVIFLLGLTSDEKLFVVKKIKTIIPISK